jgi:murein DD-endopeptidase MepM/ murein hydrolase activator NlpD
MIVGALAGVLSLSDYRVDVDTVASLPTPDWTSQDQIARLTEPARSAQRIVAKRRDRGVANTQRPARNVGMIACAAQSVLAPEPLEYGLCVHSESSEPIVLAKTAPTPTEPVVAGETAGPELPLGVAVARGHVATDDDRDFEHWPGSAELGELAAVPHGPEIPDALILARAAERLADENARIAAARLAKRARAAESEWLDEHQHLVDEGRSLSAEFTAAAQQIAREQADERAKEKARLLEQADAEAGLVMLAARRVAGERMLALIEADAEAALVLMQAKAAADARAEKAMREAMQAKAEAALELAEAKADADARAEAIERERIEAEAEAALVLLDAKAKADALAEQARMEAVAEAAREVARTKALADARAEAAERAFVEAEVEAIAVMLEAKARAEARADEAKRAFFEADAEAALVMENAKAAADAKAEARMVALIEADAEAALTMDASRVEAARVTEIALSLPVGPPLPSFLEICRARFEDPLGFGDQTLWVVGDQADTGDELQMTVYVTADGKEVDYDPEAGRVLPFDPLTVRPFDGDGESKTRRAFEVMLAADDGLHTVRYIKELNHELRSGETLSEVLSAAGLNAAQVDRWVRATQTVYDSNRVYAGQEIKLTVDMPDRILKRIRLEAGRNALIFVETNGERVLARKQDIIYERGLRVVEATIDSSLYVSAIEKRIPDRIISDMAEILGWDINFGRDLRPGSSFRAIYEQLTRVDTDETISGRVLAIEVANRGKLYEGFYFERGEHGAGGYFDRDGESLGRRFLRFPVSYSRISSPFSTARYHPVLKRRIPHYGVDFAAPTGTPVRAVADGRVLKSGWDRGNGRFVKIRHDAEYESGYAHLSRIATAAGANARVKRGQVIGYVGATGLATGPHLHFAMYKEGRYIDPMNAELPRGISLSERELAGFKMKVAMMDRAYAEWGEGEDRSTQVAAAEAPDSGDTH